MHDYGHIPLFHNKNIVLGVCGGIAAYKIADLASKLTQAGAQVDAILTESATKFVGPVTFAAVTGRAALTDADLWRHDQHVPHVQLGEKADLLIIAPATANTIAKLAHGQADNLLTVTALAARCPIILVPAMDGGMWSNAATQANVAILRERGFHFVGPASGRMASGLIGEGRMVEPSEILGYARVVLGAKGQLAGRKIVVSAGGTHEAIDPVRFIGNRSSGKQGLRHRAGRDRSGRGGDADRRRVSLAHALWRKTDRRRIGAGHVRGGAGRMPRRRRVDHGGGGG